MRRLNLADGTVDCVLAPTPHLESNPRFGHLQPASRLLIGRAGCHPAGTSPLQRAPGSEGRPPVLAETLLTSDPRISPRLGRHQAGRSCPAFPRRCTGSALSRPTCPPGERLANRGIRSRSRSGRLRSVTGPRQRPLVRTTTLAVRRKKRLDLVVLIRGVAAAMSAQAHGDVLAAERQYNTAAEILPPSSDEDSLRRSSPMPADHSKASPA